MTKVVIKREIEAEQWAGDVRIILEGSHVCRPEVHWSADRGLVYFTYADLHPHNWIDARVRETSAPEKLDFMCSGLGITRQDGSKYWRQVYPFAFWSVKSEASIKRDHHAVYLDRADAALVETFVDFLAAEGWTNPLPPRIEIRVVDGQYGRGFKPIYLKPGDWLLTERGRDPVAVSDVEFTAMAA